jgi:hypothetical protein
LHGQYKDISISAAQLLSFYTNELKGDQNVLVLLLQHCHTHSVFEDRPHRLFVVRDLLRPVIQRAGKELKKLVQQRNSTVEVAIALT